MTHCQIYSILLATERREHLLNMLVEQGYQEALSYTGAVVVDGAMMPYVRLLIPRNSNYIAHSGGLYVSLDAYEELAYAGRYYLPIVATVDPSDEVALAHELMHVADLLNTWLSHYITNIEKSWKLLHPTLTARIASAVMQSTDHHGHAVFGTRAYEATQKNWADLAPRFLARVIYGPIPKSRM